MKKNLTRKERLKRPSDIRQVFLKKKSVSCYGAKLFFLKNSFQWNRMVCIPARGFKSAVDRNKVKRHVKEIFREEKNYLLTGYDLIFIVYPDMNRHDTFSERKQKITSLLNQAGLYSSFGKEKKDL